MTVNRSVLLWSLIGVLSSAAATMNAQSFRVQCPNATPLHQSNDPSGPFTGPVPGGLHFVPDVGNPYTVTDWINGGAIKCQQISGGDGYATMADGTQTYLFGFGPLSGLYDMSQGLPGTQVSRD